jgi:hypothetical protein
MKFVFVFVLCIAAAVCVEHKTQEHVEVHINTNADVTLYFKVNGPTIGFYWTPSADNVEFEEKVIEKHQNKVDDRDDDRRMLVSASSGEV